MQTSTPVTEVLDRLGIDFKLHLHEQPLRSLEQAAQERGLEPHQIVRSLLFRTEEGTFVLVLMPGPEQVNWPKLRHFLGVSRLTTATPDEVEEVTGFEPGAVSPFGLKRSLRVLVDQRICDLEVISLGAGIRNAGIILKRQDLMRALKPEVGDFCGGSP
jgi:Cys-tRNA(Pro) deacylase